MPQEKDFLLIERSFNPLFTKLITSFFLDFGAIKSGFYLYYSSYGCSHFESLKKKDSSSIHSTVDFEDLAIFFPSTSSISSAL